MKLATESGKPHYAQDYGSTLAPWIERFDNAGEMEEFELYDPIASAAESELRKAKSPEELEAAFARVVAALDHIGNDEFKERVMSGISALRGRLKAAIADFFDEVTALAELEVAVKNGAEVNQVAAKMERAISAVADLNELYPTFRKVMQFRGSHSRQAELPRADILMGWAASRAMALGAEGSYMEGYNDWLAAQAA